jgi:hypothetical protein
MDAGPGTELGGLGWFAVVWVTMMAAMMLPSIAPMVLAHARVQLGATPAFVAGYLLTWAAVGMLGYALVEGVRSLDLGVLASDEAGPYVAGGAILAAAIYQLSPPKDRGLRRCRDPRAFVSEQWRPGLAGALRMGIEHGRVCVVELGADGRAVRARGDERRLDGPRRRADRDREAAAVADGRHPRDRGSARGARDRPRLRTRGRARPDGSGLVGRRPAMEEMGME